MAVMRQDEADNGHEGEEPVATLTFRSDGVEVAIPADLDLSTDEGSPFHIRYAAALGLWCATPEAQEVIADFMQKYNAEQKAKREKEGEDW